MPIVCEPGCDVIKFNLIFLIKPFLYMAKKSMIFKRISVAKNCHRQEGAPLKNNQVKN